jgi:MbtH protein
MFDDDDSLEYKVVINHELQYSIWPTSKPNPAGWTDAGLVGTKTVCLAHIKQIWTDLRPLSLRRAMEKGTGDAAN